MSLHTTSRLLLIGFAWTVLAGAAAAEDSPVAGPLDEQGRVVNFQRDIVPIFMANCYQCHNADNAKADFRIDDAETVMQYVEAEDAMSSDLFTLYMTSEDPDMLMPPASHGGPLAPAELALVRLWIDEGADWPSEASMIAPGDETKETAEASAAPTNLLARVWSFQGFLHPATVHFPIALLLIGGVFVVLGWKWPVLGTQIPLACLLIGAASSLAASAMGWSFAVEQGYGNWTKIDLDGEIFWHRWSAVLVTILSCGLALLALISLRGPHPKLVRTWKIGLLLVAGMVGAVGHQGGELTYGKDFYPKAFRILLGQPGKTQPEKDQPEAVSQSAPAPNVVASAPTEPATPN